MLKIISIVMLNMIFATTSFAFQLFPLSKINSKGSQQKIINKNSISDMTNPDFSGKYEGTCIVNGENSESIDGLTFTIHSSQNELQFDDYNNIRHIYRIGGVSGDFAGRDDSSSNDTFGFVAVNWNNDKSALIINSTSADKPSDPEGPMVTGLEEVKLGLQGNKLILNADMRRFDNLDEGYVRSTLVCTFTKVGNAYPLY